MIDTETRREISQAIAKCIAYKNCNKQDMVNLWALKLLQLLECQEILGKLKTS